MAARSCVRAGPDHDGVDDGGDRFPWPAAGSAGRRRGRVLHRSRTARSSTTSTCERRLPRPGAGSSSSTWAASVVACRSAPSCRSGGTRIRPHGHRRRAGTPVCRVRQGHCGHRVSGGIGGSGIGGHRAGTGAVQLTWRPWRSENGSESGVVRPGWEAEIETQGLVYNKTDLPGGEFRSYWREGLSTTSPLAEIEQLETRGGQLFAAVRRRGRRTWSTTTVRPDAHPADRPAADPSHLGGRAAQRLRAIRPARTTARGRRSSGVQRRHPDGPGRVRRHAVGLAPVHRPGRRSVERPARPARSPPGGATCWRGSGGTGVRPRVHLAWTRRSASGEDLDDGRLPDRHRACRPATRRSS